MNQSRSATIQTNVEVTGLREWEQAMHKFPAVIAKGVSDGFKELAQRGRREGLTEIKRGLTIRAVRYFEYGVKGSPLQPHQELALQRAFISRSFTAEGSVYIRGAVNPKNDLSFLLHHETGNNKRSAKGGLISVPDEKGLGNYRTPSGATKPGMTPRSLMREYSSDMQAKGEDIPWRDGAVLVRDTKTGKVFIPKKKRARGKQSSKYITHSYIRLYTFKEETKQTKKINFEKVVETFVKIHAHEVCNRHIVKNVTEFNATI